MLTVGIELSTR